MGFTVQNEDVEYPYDELHDCIECYHCGEYDMCICNSETEFSDN